MSDFHKNIILKIIERDLNTLKEELNEKKEEYEFNRFGIKLKHAKNINDIILLLQVVNNSITNKNILELSGMNKQKLHRIKSNSVKFHNPQEILDLTETLAVFLEETKEKVPKIENNSEDLSETDKSDIIAFTDFINNLEKGDNHENS